jgi:hypothetical protein
VIKRTEKQKVVSASKLKLSDPDDAPEFTEEMLRRAQIMEGDIVIRSGLAIAKKTRSTP